MSQTHRRQGRAEGARAKTAPFPPSPSRLRWGAVTQNFSTFLVARPV